MMRKEYPFSGEVNSALANEAPRENERAQAKLGAVRSVTAAMSGKLLDNTQALCELARVWLPAHTRTALEALVEDARSDVPKDLAFLKHHAWALKPRTFRGWLFVAAVFTAFVAAELAVLCTAAFLVCGLLVFSVFMLGAVALALNVVLIPSGLVLLGLAWCAGLASLTVGAGGCSLAITHMFLGRVGVLLMGESTKTDLLKAKQEDSHISSNGST